MAFNAAAAAPKARLRRWCRRLGIAVVMALSAGGAVADPPFQTIGPADAQVLIGRGVPVVDLRTPPEWRQTGVIAGAARITAFDAKGRFVPGFPDAFTAIAGPGDEVVLICWTGARSEAIAEALSTRIGYSRVYNVAGGMAAWIGDGRAIQPCTDC